MRASNDQVALRPIAAAIALSLGSNKSTRAYRGIGLSSRMVWRTLPCMAFSSGVECPLCKITTDVADDRSGSARDGHGRQHRSFDPVHDQGPLPGLTATGSPGQEPPFIKR